jgi:hypothetical protein
MKRISMLTFALRVRGLKKQTAIFQLTGQTFGKVSLPLAETPGPEGDPKLSAATLIHDFVEPIRWVTPTMLKLNWHDYYQTTDRSGSSRDSALFMTSPRLSVPMVKPGPIPNL